VALAVCAATLADELPAPNEDGVLAALMVWKGTVRGTTSTRNSRLSSRDTAFAVVVLARSMVKAKYKG
jgi:hypothetical protein